ncbi:MAG: long-chain-acyl-CoA synthetase [Alphaproteobacteria bacterium]
MGLLREAKYLRDMGRAIIAISKFDVSKAATVPDYFEQMVDRRKDAPLFYFEDEILSYRQIDDWANQFAHYLTGQGIGKDDVIAINMENCPAYVAAWMGAAKIGATSALINTNLGGAQLAHCLNVAKAKLLVLGAELADQFNSARDALDPMPAILVDGDGALIDGASALSDAIDGQPTTRPDKSCRAGMTLGDSDLFYIYTSGTTGLPKAAHFSHLRFMMTATGSGTALKLGHSDRHYICLPLYHTAGGVMALGAAWTMGAAAVLVPKFSASRFFADAVKYDVTSFQYIGELLRYLVNSPAVPEEKMHKITRCIGNGLRPEIWETVETRFGINKVVEFYGATEGNVALMNLEGKRGTVGRLPGYLRKATGVTCVRYDVENDEVMRGPDGLCIECKPGEPGEAVGRLPTSSDAKTGRFEGYSDESATKKKILNDVFEKGDAFFRTGDLLRFDKDGYWYFVDRIGDTFRWKGENVATSEVAEVIAVMDHIDEVNIYGVQIPGADGRAGMASIVAGDGFDLAAFHAQTQKDLAAYARPLFLRMQPEIEITGTFKHRKVDLVKDGFDPDKIAEPLYFRDSETGSYVPLDKALYDRIIAGEVRV